MKKLAVLLALAIPLLSLAAASKTTEVLVLTTATAMPQMAGRKGFEIQNLGPNPIYCAFTSAAAVVNKARKIDAGGTWSLDVTSYITTYCITTVNQVTGAATVVSEG